MMHFTHNVKLPMVISSASLHMLP
jgi:hypothetical protein